MGIIREYQEDNSLDPVPEVPVIRAPSIQFTEQPPAAEPEAVLDTPAPQSEMPVSAPMMQEIADLEQPIPESESVLPRVEIPELAPVDIPVQAPAAGSTPPAMQTPQLDRSPRIPFQNITVDIDRSGWERIDIPRATMPNPEPAPIAEDFLRGNLPQLLQPANNPGEVYAGNPVLDFLTNIFGGKDLYERYYKRGIGQTGAASGLLYGLTLPWNVVNGVAADLGRIGSGIVAGRESLSRDWMKKAASESTSVGEFAQKILNQYSKSYWNQINATATNGGTYTQQALLGRQFSFADERVNEQKDFNPFGLLPEYGSYTRAPNLKETELSKRVRNTEWLNQATAVLGVPVEAAFQAISGNKNIKIPKFSDWLADRLKQAQRDPNNYYRSIAGFALDAIGGASIEDLPRYVTKGLTGASKTAAKTTVKSTTPTVHLPFSKSIEIEPAPSRPALPASPAKTPNPQLPEPPVPPPMVSAQRDAIITPPRKDIERLIRESFIEKYGEYDLSTELLRSLLENPKSRLTVMDGQLAESLQIADNVIVEKPLLWREIPIVRHTAASLDRPITPRLEGRLQALGEAVQAIPNVSVETFTMRQYIGDILRETQLPMQIQRQVIDMAPADAAEFIRTTPLLPPSVGADLLDQYMSAAKFQSPDIAQMVKELTVPNVVSDFDNFVEQRALVPRSMRPDPEDSVKREQLQYVVDTTFNAEQALVDLSTLYEKYEKLVDEVDNVDLSEATRVLFDGVNTPGFIATAGRGTVYNNVPGGQLYTDINTARDASQAAADPSINFIGTPTARTYSLAEGTRIMPLKESRILRSELEKLENSAPQVRDEYFREVAKSYDITADGLIINPDVLQATGKIPFDDVNTGMDVRLAEFNSKPSQQSSQNLRAQMLDDIERELEEAGMNVDVALDDMYDAFDTLDDDLGYGSNYGISSDTEHHELFQTLFEDLQEEQEVLRRIVKTGSQAPNNREWIDMASDVLEALRNDELDSALDDLLSYRNRHPSMYEIVDDFYKEITELYTEAKTKVGIELPIDLFPDLDEIC